MIDALRASGRDDRGLLGRWRPGRSRHDGPVGPVLGVGQHRSARPATHPARLQPALPGPDDGGDLTAWPDDAVAEARELIAAYKQVRHIVQFGRQYRLGEPSRSPAAVQYVTADAAESVVFVYAEAQQFDLHVVPIPLCGLDPAASYRLDDGTTLSGAALMGHGIAPALTGDYASTMIHLTQAPWRTACGHPDGGS